jgi:hypothetical protein
MQIMWQRVQSVRFLKYVLLLQNISNLYIVVSGKSPHLSTKRCMIYILLLFFRKTKHMLCKEIKDETIQSPEQREVER